MKPLRKISVRAGAKSTILRLSLLACIAAAPISALVDQPNGVFPWTGQTLPELNGPNAEAIRATYGPILLAYPTLSSCVDAGVDSDAEMALRRSDLRKLPGLPAAEVCIFHYLHTMTSVNEIVEAMSNIGFDQNEVLSTGTGFHINMVWREGLGPLVSDNGWTRLWAMFTTTRGTKLKINLHKTLGLTGVRMSPISSIQF